jgi:hypothetical protein
LIHQYHSCLQKILIFPRKNEYVLSFPPEKWVYTRDFHLKNEYILNFPPILVFSPLLF